MIKIYDNVCVDSSKLMFKLCNCPEFSPTYTSTMGCLLPCDFSDLYYYDWITNLEIPSLQNACV